MYEKVYASPRRRPTISLKHDWTKELGSEVAVEAEGEVARQAEVNHLMATDLGRLKN